MQKLHKISVKSRLATFFFLILFLKYKLGLSFFKQVLYKGTLPIQIDINNVSA